MSKNTKVKLIGLFSVILVAILGATFIKGAGGSSEKKLAARLEEVGSDFYENFYHEQISNNKSEEELEEFLERFEETGIKIDLDNLSRYDNEKYPNLLEEFVNVKDKEIQCDIRNTKAIIYPKRPFGKDDYTIETELDCGQEVEVNHEEEPEVEDVETDDVESEEESNE